MNGRDEEQLASAVQAGYRPFDTAESYRNNGLVAEALRGLPRDSYEILYKFDVRNGEPADGLRRRWHGVAGLFGGRLDALVIHNLDADPQTLRAAWQVLNELKGDGAAQRIGLGNVGESHVGLLPELGAAGGIDLVENSVESVLLSETVEQAIKASGAHLYYYDVIRTASQMGLDLSSPDDLNGFIYTMAGNFPGPGGESNATMVSSSGTAITQQTNLKNFGRGPDHDGFTGDEQYAALDKISDWRKQRSVCQDNGTSFILRPELAAWLSGLCEGTGAQALRGSLTQAAQRQGRQVERTFVGQWLVGQGHVAEADLDGVRVPLERASSGGTSGCRCTRCWRPCSG
ncbi:aldo/keto reductase [Streptomyces sp. NPDC047049]|uniref:aldo/keto reductase n=1 Tax=Streptomyces sp. NPDC047049 TaxID=3156688 RepID=UPI0034067C04